MWRISQDIGASWHSILNNLDFDEPWAKYAGPGSINGAILFGLFWTNIWTISG